MIEIAVMEPRQGNRLDQFQWLLHLGLQLESEQNRECEGDRKRLFHFASAANFRYWWRRCLKYPSQRHLSASRVYAMVWPFLNRRSTVGFPVSAPTPA